MRHQREKVGGEAASSAHGVRISYILYLETFQKRPFKGQGEISVMFLENE